MATAYGPSIPHHPTGAFSFPQPVYPPPVPPSSAKPTSTSSRSTANGIKQDPFYGQEVTAKLCARFITHLFTCPDYPPSSSGMNVKLPQFIAYALYRTKLHSSVTFASLVLLQRLKARFPTARGSSGHRLFLSAFMIASKVICDDTYSNKSWSIVGQGMFQLREINQMEREMCTYLEWELNVDPKTLKEFESMVRHDFNKTATAYPTYVLQGASIKATAAAVTAPVTPSPTPPPTATATTSIVSPSKPMLTSTSPIPSFGPKYDTPQSVVVAPPQSKATPPPLETAKPAKVIATNVPYPSPPSSSSPVTPVTPGSTRSDGSSLSSDGAPRTPPSTEDHNIKVFSSSSSAFSQPSDDLLVTDENGSWQYFYEYKRKDTFAIPAPAKW